MDVLPPWKLGNEEWTTEGAHECPDRYAAVEDSLSGADGDVDAEDFLECFSIDLPQIYDAVAEVKGGKADVPDDEGNAEFGFVGDPFLEQRILRATRHWYVDFIVIKNISTYSIFQNQ